LTKTPKLTRAKRITEWTTYDEQVAEMAKRLLKKDAERKGNATVVDESMFNKIDSAPKEAIAEPSTDSTAERRVKDEL
jgi:hypothetical protein